MGKLCIGAWTLIYNRAKFPRVPVLTSLATGATLYILQHCKKELYSLQWVASSDQVLGEKYLHIV